MTEHQNPLNTERRSPEQIARDLFSIVREKLSPPAAKPAIELPAKPEPIIDIPKPEPVLPRVEGEPLPPPPEPEKIEVKKLSLDTELSSALKNLDPSHVDAELARTVADLVAGKKPVHCVRAGLTEQQLLLTWGPLVEGWWSGLGEEKRTKFETAAVALRGASTDAEKERQAAQKIGYRRMLDGIFARNPRQLYETFYNVKNGREAFCPAGFTEADCVQWNVFLKEDWFASLSADEKIRLDAAAQRQRTLPALIEKKEAELAQKIAQLKKVNSLSGKVALFFNAGQEKGIVHPDFLEREILELRRELIELGVSKFIDDEIAQVDAHHQEIGDKTGFGARALDATRRLFSWVHSQEKTRAPQSLKGKVFGGLTGAYFNVPGVVERWMLEAGCSHAVGTLGEKGAAEKNNETAADLRAQNISTNASGRPEVDWTAYALALQYRISVEISRVVQKSQSLKVAVEREPLAGLLKAYKEVAPRIAPALREKQERVNSLLAHLVAETEQDLRARASVRGVNIEHLVAQKDTHWIQTLLEDREALDENRVVAPSATPESVVDHQKLAFKYSVLVGPQKTTSAIVREIAAKFDTTKTPAALNRDTLQFLTQGWVFDEGDTAPKRLMNAGREEIHLYVGDRVVAVQDAAAPFGFHITIERNAAPVREGYVLDDSHGNPEWYYQRVPNKSVYAWKINSEGHMRLAGHFEGKKFIKETEKMWSYSDAHGKKRQIGEFAEGIFFKPDGTVVSKNKSRKGSAFTEIGKLTEKIEAKVTITKKDGSEESVDLQTKGKAFYITPAGKLVEYHASVNEMRELGTLKR